MATPDPPPELTDRQRTALEFADLVDTADQHLDLEFYDRFFKPGAYLDSHRHHFEVWH
ncbi:MAG: hypothetical protein ACRDNK_01305 [Solirubrobacteraceae bacterium]